MPSKIDRAHSCRSERCILSTKDERVLLMRFAEHVRGDGLSVTGHRSAFTPFDVDHVSPD